MIIILQLNTILQTHNYNSDLIAIMTPQKGVGITPANVTFRLPAYIHFDKQRQSVVHVQKCRDRNVPRPKCRVPLFPQPKVSVPSETSPKITPTKKFCLRETEIF